MTFKKGVSGNPSGRPKLGHNIADYIRTALDRVDENTTGKTNAERIAEKLIGMSLCDDDELSLRASREILDRMIGRPVQQIIEESHQEIRVTREILRKEKD